MRVDFVSLCFNLHCQLSTLYILEPVLSFMAGSHALSILHRQSTLDPWNKKKKIQQCLPSPQLHLMICFKTSLRQVTVKWQLDMPLW